MGPVNLVADDEYRELQERLEFLRSQHDDLVQSMKDLDRALRGMTRTAQERFQEAFEEINRHFGEIFQRLFEGGRAELRMVPPEEGEDDPLELGVELMAQPRGKRLQAVTLMSGGERALTGLALLFAIFYYRPSPFCVLDEVDAPLDDANIHRFIRVLRELCSQTQFIVITHNRKTMEAADVLYGVTMQEPGLSRLVSVKLNAHANRRLKNLAGYATLELCRASARTCEGYASSKGYRSTSSRAQPACSITSRSARIGQHGLAAGASLHQGFHPCVLPGHRRRP